MEMQHQFIQKKQEKVTAENEVFRKKISSLEADMDKHIKAGEAQIKSLENKDGTSIDTTIANSLVLFNAEQADSNNADNEKQRRVEPALAAVQEQQFDLVIDPMIISNPLLLTRLFTF